MPPAPARNARRLIPSFLAALSASSLVRASTRFCSWVWGMGIHSPFDTIWVGIGDGKGSASALAHFASCASLSHVSTLRSSRAMLDSPFLGLCGNTVCEAETAGRVRGAGEVEGRRARADLTRLMGDTATGPGDHPSAGTTP